MTFWRIYSGQQIKCVHLCAVPMHEPLLKTQRLIMITPVVTNMFKWVNGEKKTFPEVNAK